MKRQMKRQLATLILAVPPLLFGSVSAAPPIEGIWNPAPVEGGSHPPPEQVSLTPAGRARYEGFSEEVDPTIRCILPGVPLGVYDPYPLEIIQQEHQIVFLYEHFHMVRRIFMDGREPPADWWPSLVGFSVGNWEDDTLVVRTTHMSPDNLMWHNGMPFSGDEDSYMIERYEFEGDGMSMTAEVFDPTYYEEPYVIRGNRRLDPDGMIFEYECVSEFSAF